MPQSRRDQMFFSEFVILMAMYVALMAMSIDMMLPSLATIGHDLGIEEGNHAQYIVSTLFLGFALGQIIYGPISDSFGRKPVVYVGLIIFIVGDIICLMSANFTWMIIGRTMQGFGAASPRTIGIAITRDMYEGREMAKVMSIVMTIFIIVPVLAPALGQAVLLVSSWRVFFLIFLFMALIAMLWTYFRLPETLTAHNRKAFKPKVIINDFYKVINNKITLGYTICMGMVFGALIGYLNSSQQIFQDYFGVGNMFPIYFGITALSIGASSIINSLIVKRFGMRLICHYSLMFMTIISTIFLTICIVQDDQMYLWQFMIFIIMTFFFMGLLFGNLNSLAMEEMGHYAGTASALIGSLSSAISVAIGTIIGQSYNSTLMPVMTCFLILSAGTFLYQIKVAKSASKALLKQI